MTTLLDFQHKSKQYWIYGLCDPITKEIRYIGRSMTGMTRVRQHCAPSTFKKYEGKPLPKNLAWIKSLLNKGLKPHVIIIEECQSFEELNDTEIFYISYFKSITNNLNNLVAGGKGGSRGYIKSSETRQKQAEKMRKIFTNPLKRKQHSENLLKTFSNPDYSHPFKGKKLTEKHKQNMSKGRLGKPRKPETVAKLKKIITEQRGRKIIDHNNIIYASLSECGRAYNLTPRQIKDYAENLWQNKKGYKFRYL